MWRKRCVVDNYVARGPTAVIKSGLLDADPLVGVRDRLTELRDQPVISGRRSDSYFLAGSSRIAPPCKGSWAVGVPAWW